MEGSTEGVFRAGPGVCSGSPAVLATAPGRWGGPIPPFTFYWFGFRPSCDADLGKPLRRNRIVINRM
jgi:hypothetical protein